MFISNWEQDTFTSGVSYMISKVILNINIISTNYCVSKYKVLIFVQMIKDELIEFISIINLKKHVSKEDYYFAE